MQMMYITVEQWGSSCGVARNKTGDLLLLSRRRFACEGKQLEINQKTEAKFAGTHAVGYRWLLQVHLHFYIYDNSLCFAHRDFSDCDKDTHTK